MTVTGIIWQEVRSTVVPCKLNEFKLTRVRSVRNRDGPGSANEQVIMAMLH
jgi:type IV secretory pathway TrbF-like protein